MTDCGNRTSSSPPPAANSIKVGIGAAVDLVNGEQRTTLGGPQGGQLGGCGSRQPRAAQCTARLYSNESFNESESVTTSQPECTGHPMSACGHRCGAGGKPWDVVSSGVAPVSEGVAPVSERVRVCWCPELWLTEMMSPDISINSLHY